MEISITKTTTPKQKPADESKLGFGQYYTDHMFIMNYDEGEGWHNPRIVPYGPFELDPAAMVLHFTSDLTYSLLTHTLVFTLQSTLHLQLFFHRSEHIILKVSHLLKSSLNRSMFVP